MNRREQTFYEQLQIKMAEEEYKGLMTDEDLRAYKEGVLGNEKVDFYYDVRDMLVKIYANYSPGEIIEIINGLKGKINPLLIEHLEETYSIDE